MQLGAPLSWSCFLNIFGLFRMLLPMLSRVITRSIVRGLTSTRAISRPANGSDSFLVGFSTSMCALPHFSFQYLRRDQRQFISTFVLTRIGINVFLPMINCALYYASDNSFALSYLRVLDLAILVYSFRASLLFLDICGL